MAIDHEIEQGQSAVSLAYVHGFHWKTVWNHEKNAKLKKERVDPNVLYPGDILHIPDLTLKEHQADSDKRHRFRRKGVPSKLRIRLTTERYREEEVEEEKLTTGLYGDDQEVSEEPSGKPPPRPVVEFVANAPCQILIDGVLHKVTTDGDGLLEITVRPDAILGSLAVRPGEPDELTYELGLSHLDPITTVRGVKQRLRALGDYWGEMDEFEDQDFSSGVAHFQRRFDLDPTGDVDNETRDKIKEEFGA